MTTQATTNPGPTPADDAAPAAGFELSSVLRILMERRQIILGAMALGLVLGIVISLMTTPLYRSTALLELNNQTNDMIDGTTRAMTLQNKMANQELLATQLGLLRSEALAKRVVQDLNLASVPELAGAEGPRDLRTKIAVANVRGGTEATAVKGAMLIQISFVSSDPNLAAKVTNGIANGFIASGLERRFGASAYARDFLAEQIARTKVALEDSERKLNQYSIASGVFRTQGATVDGKTAEGGTLGQSSLTALNEALSAARIRRIAAEQDYKSNSVDFASETAANVSTLVAQRTDLQAQYDEKSKIFKPDYPAMRELKARISRIDASINAERSRASGGKRAELKGVYDAAVRAEAQIAAELAAAKGDVQVERSRSIQYNILQREADTNRSLYDALLQRYKEVGVAAGVGQSNVAIVDPAEPAGGPFRPRLAVNAVVGMLLGLALGLALAFAVHLLFDAVTDPNDVREKLKLPLLGVVPVDSADRTMLEALEDRKSDVSEAYYSVRTALKFSSPEGAPKTLLVSSTRPGEGKSTSSYAIAMSMARLGGRVLLVDADLRKPTFVSGREDGYGLAHLLGVDEPIDAYAEATQVPNLSLLPVGRFVGSAAELLSSNRLPAIIAEAGGKYDMVVIDGPPVLGLTDAPLLAAATQATVLIIESGETRTGHAQESIRRLAASGARIVGVILTKYSNQGSQYGYSYYSYGSDSEGGIVSSAPTRRFDVAARDA